MTNKEKIDILLRYFSDENGNINLNRLDLGEIDLHMEHIKTKGNIHNSYQKAFNICNSGQIALEGINNEFQKAKRVYNRYQNTKLFIYNGEQNSKYIYNYRQKAIKILY